MYITDKCIFCEIEMVYKPFEEAYECPICGSIAYENDNEDVNE